jgi:uncharacterized protein (TIGR02145 family)
MKTFTLASALLLSSFIGLYAQSGLTIKSGGAVTVNGNTIINPPAFVCGSPLVDIRDGHTYNTVLIGTQCWMANNLNIGSKVIGLGSQINNGVIEKFCYNNDDGNCAIYGGLYQWAEMVQYLNGATNTTSWSPAPNGNVQGVCPYGWHIPSDAEWTVLSDFLGGVWVAGGKMKEAGTAHWSSPNTGATNESGFTSLPAGLSSYYNGNFGYLGTYSGFWASTEYLQFNTQTALLRDLNNTDATLRWTGDTKTYGHSVRCIKD